MQLAISVTRTRALTLVPVMAALGACSAEGAHDAPARIEVRTAALSFAELGHTCFDLEVHNGTSLVWSQGDPLRTRLGADQTADNGPADAIDPADADLDAICSDDFGNGGGGAIAYVGPCDATADSDANPDNGVQNLVTLWVDGLYDDAGASDIGQWRDPCPPSGCELHVDCGENEDSLVEFNLTIMREADQGFFDIAVNFDDIFCSAKIDCTQEALLHHPVSAERGRTIVLALACTAGPNATKDTTLLRDPIVIACDGSETVLDPALGEGMVYGRFMSDPDLDDAVWQYATYFGSERLGCGGVPCDKQYWNVAIGFDASFASCTLSTTATAGSRGTIDAFTTPALSTYPLIEHQLTLTGPDGGLSCGEHPLDGSPAGLATSYTPIAAGASLCARFDGPGMRCDEDASCPEAPVPTVSEGYVVNDSVPGAMLPVGLAHLGGETLVVSFFDQGDSGPGSRTLLTRSTDLGVTWEQTPHFELASADPRVGIAAGIDTLPNGTPVLIAMENLHVDTTPEAVFLPRRTTLKLYRSHDGGLTFPDVTTLDTAPYALTATMGRVVELPGGDLIIPAYSYTYEGVPGYPEFGPRPGYAYGSGFFRSSDGGVTWSRLQVAFSDPPPDSGFLGFNEASYVVRGDGSIVAHARIDRPEPFPNRLWTITSSDDGLTWSAPERTEIDGLWPAIARISDCAYLMVAGDRGAAVPRSVTLYRSSDAIDFEALQLAPYVRTDGWIHPATGGAQNLVELPDGSWYMVYYAHRDPSVATVPADLTTYIEGARLTFDRTVIGARTAADPGRWSNNGTAASCLGYLEPEPGYRYAGSTGDGVYLIDPDRHGPAAPFPVYCDMDGGGWTRLMGATHPFLFDDTTWELHNAGDPTAANFSALGARQAFAREGCYEMRFVVGETTASDPLGGGDYFRTWRQCHDAFTEATAGEGYTALDGWLFTHCDGIYSPPGAPTGFTGLHNDYTGFSRATDVDTNDQIECWRMQVVPTALYLSEGAGEFYLDAFPSRLHKWQSLWYR